MKKFNITVNGTVYEVEVEEVNVFSEAIASAEASAPAAKPAPVASGKEGAVKIAAPMPGTIIKIIAEKGQKVKKNELILVFEAMKMENDLVSPQDGTIVSVNTSKGAIVNAGDILFTME